MSTEECVVCNDPLEEELLPCGHCVHQVCIARSGKEQCPVCRRETAVAAEYRDQLNEAIRQNREREEQQNREAAVEIARQHNDDEEDDEEPMVRTRSILIGHRIVRWIRREAPEYTLTQIFEEVARLNYAHHNEEIECDERSIELARLMYRAAEVSATSNTTLREIFETMLTIWSE